MASIQFVEEPGNISEGFVGRIASPRSAQQNYDALTFGPENFDIRWDESRWTQGILNEDGIKTSRAKLDQHVDNFLAVATDEEKEILSRSRDEFQTRVADAIAASKLHQPSATTAGPSVADHLKHGLNATSAVAYEYIKILDVMVGQAPEYVGPVYGAIKILLVAQVNNEEVKEKVKEYLEQIQLKFQIIDHLTLYMPSSRLVTLIAQVYCLFNTFLAKAIKHYTQPRLRRYLKAFTMPWKRFQDIVDSIEVKLVSIKDVAQHIGLVEGHATMMASQQTHALLKKNMEGNQEIRDLVEEISIQLDAISVKFSKPEGVRQTADSLAKLAEERLNEPTMADVDSNVAAGQDIATNLHSAEGTEDFDSWQNTLFPELRESSEKASRHQRANEELPGMRTYRAKRKSFENSEIVMAWAESRKSEILWINGNEVLSREDFNASFVCPLMLVGESHFDTFTRLQHFCEETRGETDPYVVMMQDLVSQFLRQHSTSMSSQQRVNITRERTATTEGLWDLLLELISGTEIPCTFLVIGGIDHIVACSPRPGEMRTEIIHRLRALTTDTQKVIKIMVAMDFFQSTTTSVENISSLVRAHNPQNQRRRLSLDGLQSAFPGQLTSQHLTDIQEGRHRAIAFTEIPLLYTPGTMVYTEDNDKLAAFVVAEMSGMEPRPFGSFAPLRIRVWSIDHDGQRICKRYQDLTINYFVGRRDISSLACIPSGYLPEEMTKRKQIISRGQKYWSYVSGVHYVEVHSQQVSLELYLKAFYHKSKSAHNFTQGYHQGVIDQSARPIDLSILESLEPLGVRQGAVIKSRFLMLAPAQISVYAVRGLTWLLVDLEELAPLEFPVDPLRRLIITDDGKQLLVRAIEAVKAQSHHQQIAPATLRMDPRPMLMGRRFLLFHGSNGTGKSFAAQCLANHARRPLFVVTSGMKADEDAIGCLRTVFKLAKRWDCLVLMDHLGTLMKSQGTSDFEGDVIVTEILDFIDNYQSILIATTDQVRDLDLRLVFRANTVMHFGLNDWNRRLIWTDCILASGSQKCLTEEDDDNISQISKFKIDGHGIANIIQSAARTARSEQRDINLKDLKAQAAAYDEMYI